MRNLLVCLILAATPAWGQAPSTSKAPASTKAPANGKAPATGTATERSTALCADCGVVRAVRTVTKELKSEPANESKPSGLVASVPLGPGGGKASVGSSSRYGKDVVTKSEHWEITIRMDDGRFRILNVDQNPELREGDKVRVDANGKVILRTD